MVAGTTSGCGVGIGGGVVDGHRDGMTDGLSVAGIGSQQYTNAIVHNLLLFLNLFFVPPYDFITAQEPSDASSSGSFPAQFVWLSTYVSPDTHPQLTTSSLLFKPVHTLIDMLAAARVHSSIFAEFAFDAVNKFDPCD